MITTAQLRVMADAARARGDVRVAALLDNEADARAHAAEVPDANGARHWSSASEVPDGAVFHHSRWPAFRFIRAGESVSPHPPGTPGWARLIEPEHIDSAFSWDAGDFVEVPRSE